jgi:hypothetical protein
MADEIDFGDGTTYKIPHMSDVAAGGHPHHHDEASAAAEHFTREEPFVDDYDRASTADRGAKSLFNERLGKFELYAGRAPARRDEDRREIMQRGARGGEHPQGQKVQQQQQQGRRPSNETRGRPRAEPPPPPAPQQQQQPARDNKQLPPSNGRDVQPRIPSAANRDLSSEFPPTDHPPTTEPSRLHAPQAQAPAVPPAVPASTPAAQVQAPEPATSQQEPAPPTAEPVVDLEQLQHQEMLSAAERARRRRQQEEEARQAERERAMKKARELEERLKLKEGAIAVPKPTPAVAKPAEAAPAPSEQPQHVSPHSQPGAVSAAKEVPAKPEERPHEPSPSVRSRQPLPSQEEAARAALGHDLSGRRQPQQQQQPPVSVADRAESWRPSRPVAPVSSTPAATTVNEPKKIFTRETPSAAAAAQSDAQSVTHASRNTWRRDEAIARKHVSTSGDAGRHQEAKAETAAQLVTAAGTHHPRRGEEQATTMQASAPLVSTDRTTSAKPTVKLGSISRSSPPEQQPAPSKPRSTDISSLDNLLSRVKGAMTASKLVAQEEARGPPPAKPVNEVKPSVSVSQQPSINKPAAADAGGQTRATTVRPPAYVDRDPLQSFEATRQQRPPSPPPAWKQYPIRLPQISIKRPALSQRQLSRYNQVYRGNSHILSWNPTHAQVHLLFREHFLFRKKIVNGTVVSPVRLPTRRIAPGSASSSPPPAGWNSSSTAYGKSPPLDPRGRGGGAFGVARVKGRSDEGPWRRMDPVSASSPEASSSSAAAASDGPEAPETVSVVDIATTTSALSPSRNATTIAVSLPTPRGERVTSYAVSSPAQRSSTTAAAAAPEAAAAAADSSSRARSKLPQGSNVAFYRRGSTHSEITPDSTRVFKFGSVGDGIAPVKRTGEEKPAAIGQGRARESSAAEVRGAFLFFLFSFSGG